jgi:DNA-binding NtrC family response regulator
MGHAVLIIESDAGIAKTINSYLVRHGFEVRTVPTAEAGLKQIDAFKPDAILLDLDLPGMNGLETLGKLRRLAPDVRVTVITGRGNVEPAVEALKAGACDFLTKPVSLGKLKIALERSLGEERIEQTLDHFSDKIEKRHGLDLLLGKCEPIRALKATIVRLLEAEANLQDGDSPAVLVTGETGTGKEVVARAIHYNGPRRGKPFVEINCATIPQQLLESELFGHERGSFTDAKERKLGLVETADGGTLFLDEIGDMDLGLQAKLIKLLEEKTVRRIGSLRDQRVDVRIIAATHRPLEQLVREGKFRSDLFFRLRIVHLDVPPLRDRGQDILLLARHFLRLHGARYGRDALSLAPGAERALAAHRWPGNVRELRNVMEQAALLTQDDVIDAEHLHLASALTDLGDAQRAAEPREAGFDLPGGGIQFEEVERNLLLQALQKTDWNVTRAARQLGLSRDTLRYRIAKFGLSPAH